MRIGFLYSCKGIRTQNGFHRRFKLRESSLSGSHLIPYLRPDSAEAKTSFYLRIPVENTQSVKELFGEILGVHKIIRKQREIFMYQNVRIHLDCVENLGDFVELEAVMDEKNQDIKSEMDKISFLKKALGITEQHLIKGSYENYKNES